MNRGSGHAEARPTGATASQSALARRGASGALRGALAVLGATLLFALVPAAGATALPAELTLQDGGGVEAAPGGVPETAPTRLLESAPGVLRSPAGLAVSPAGDIWVADSGADSVVELAPNGTVIRRVGEPGSGPGQFAWPRGVALDPEGHVWVLDSDNARIEEFSSTGQFLGQLGSEGTGEGQLLYPGGIAIDHGGDIWVAEGANGRVQEFTPTGGGSYQPRQFAERDTVLTGAWPQAIAVGPEGDVWVSDPKAANVQQYTPSGQPLLKIVGSPAFGLTLDSNGDVWVAQPYAGEITEYTHDGSTRAQYAIEGLPPGQRSLPYAIAIANNGDLIVGDPGSRRVQQLTPTGEPVQNPEEPPGKPEQPQPPGGESRCDLYASTSGSNAQSGRTEGEALRTVEKLVDKLKPGQTGCLVSGQTFVENPQWGVSRQANGEPKPLEAQEELRVPHGEAGKPITVTSTRPEEPATISGRIVTEKGANWLTFSHLVLTYSLSQEGVPSPTIGSAHTSWTYDDISGGDVNICVSPTPAGDPYGSAQYTLVEHDRIHDCGHPFTLAEYGPADEFEGRLSGYHAHGVYDEGEFTTIRNDYIYANSGNGVLLRGGSHAVVEHNVIDANGHGVEFGNENDTSGTVAWNTITNSTSPCYFQELALDGHRGCNAFGVFYYTHCEAGVTCQTPTGNVVADNDVYGNLAGNIPGSENPPGWVTLEENIESDPLYANAPAHYYPLEPGPVKEGGYGPVTPPVSW